MSKAAKFSTMFFIVILHQILGVSSIGFGYKNIA